MATDFNPLTQKLVLKPEFEGISIEISVPKVAYGGVKYNEVRKFDSNLITEDQYEEYFTFGFYFIFDVIDIPLF
jgi:hypothetical protein